MYISPLYLLFSLPAVLLGLWAQMRVKAAVEKWSRVFTGRGDGCCHRAHYFER